jgi:hypothetical protein
MPQQQQVLQSNRGILKKVSTAETPSMDLLQAGGSFRSCPLEVFKGTVEIEIYILDHSLGTKDFKKGGHGCEGIVVFS